MSLYNIDRVIVTGGAGFIGSHVVDRLLALGKSVLIIDNYSTGLKRNNSPHINLTIIEASIADAALVSVIFRDFSPDLVIHAAASYSDPDNWEEDINTNIMGTANVVRASKATNTKRIIYLQTSLCYGLNPIQQPITLSNPYFSGSFSGGSSYAISKTTAEMYVELSGLDFVSFRLANTYGPRNMTGPLPAFYSRINSGRKIVVTSTRRDFIFIDDVVDCIIQAANGQGESGYYHLSTGVDHSIRELFDETVKQLGTTYDNVVFREKGVDDVSTILLDPQATFRDFGWTAKISLPEGIGKSIQYYKTFGINKTYTHLRGINE
jgi:UDP-glucose 4-epimerase